MPIIIDSQAARERIAKAMMDAYTEAKRSEGLNNRVTVMIVACDLEMLPASTAIGLYSDQPNKDGMTRLIGFAAQYADRMVVGNSQPLLKDPVDRGRSRG